MEAVFLLDSLVSARFRVERNPFLAFVDNVLLQVIDIGEARTKIVSCPFFIDTRVDKWFKLVDDFGEDVADFCKIACGCRRTPFCGILLSVHSVFFRAKKWFLCQRTGLGTPLLQEHWASRLARGPESERAPPTLAEEVLPVSRFGSRVREGWAA